MPPKGSLTENATREWYKAQLSTIDNKIADLPDMKSKAEAAFKIRNNARATARELMKDTDGASGLDVTKPHLTFDDVYMKSEQKLINDMGTNNPTSDQIYQEVIESSKRSNPAIDAKYGF